MFRQLSARTSGGKYGGGDLLLRLFLLFLLRPRLPFLLRDFLDIFPPLPELEPFILCPAYTGQLSDDRTSIDACGRIQSSCFTDNRQNESPIVYMVT